MAKLWHRSLFAAKICFFIAFNGERDGFTACFLLFKNRYRRVFVTCFLVLENRCAHAFITCFLVLENRYRCVCAICFLLFKNRAMQDSVFLLKEGEASALLPTRQSRVTKLLLSGIRGSFKTHKDTCSESDFASVYSTVRRNSSAVAAGPIPPIMQTS